MRRWLQFGNASCHDLLITIFDKRLTSGRWQPLDWRRPATWHHKLMAMPHTAVGPCSYLILCSQRTTKYCNNGGNYGLWEFCPRQLPLFLMGRGPMLWSPSTWPCKTYFSIKKSYGLFTLTFRMLACKNIHQRVPLLVFTVVESSTT